MEVLSPDVKEFLRKNRIRVRKSNGSIGPDDGGDKGSDMNSKRSKKSSSNNYTSHNTQTNFYQNPRKTTINDSQLLNVPEKRKKKTFS